MNIANTRVGTRLSIGFLLVLILLGAVTALGIFHLSKTQKRLETVLTVNNVESRLAGTMRNSVMDRMIALRNIILVNDAAETETQLERIRDQERQYRSAEEQLDQLLAATPADSDTRKLLTKIRATLNNRRFSFESQKIAA